MIFPDLIELLSALNLVMIVAIPFGVFIALRGSMAKTAQEVQDRVRVAMQDENQLLTVRLKRSEEQCERLVQKLDMAIETLEKKYKIELEFDDGTITLRDSTGMHVTRIKTKEES